MNLFGILLAFWLVISLPLQSASLKKIAKDPPPWMIEELRGNFTPYKGKKISLKKINKLYDQRANDWLLVKFAIKDRKVYFKTKIPKDHFVYYRITTYKRAIANIAEKMRLPDMTFLISMADGLDLPKGYLEGIPIFAMCRSIHGEHCILIPDFEALNQSYQVLKDQDVTRYQSLWNSKIPRMVWRGSTAQGTIITNSNFHQLSRVTLCALSNELPLLIDAKFTIFAQLGEPVPYLEQLRGERLSFEEQFNYKYHILIDGNASSYSTSGWKFFTNSLVFKPDSKWVQWYYNQLIAWEHYVPVDASLMDLVENIQWAIQNDMQAEIIANNGCEFARSHLTLPDSMGYLYLSLKRYSKLKFHK